MGGFYIDKVVHFEIPVDDTEHIKLGKRKCYGFDPGKNICHIPHSTYWEFTTSS